MIKIVKDYKNAMLLTHAGVFHPDEVMATAIIDLYSGETGIVGLYRTSEVPSDFEGIVYDIGGGEFDHHQKGGNGVRPNGIPYASCGLIWNKFAELIINTICPSLSDDDISSIKNAVDSAILTGIDARDNGVFNSAELYSSFTISDAISGFNPEWNSNKSSDHCFIEAVSFAKDVLMRFISRQVSVVKARYIVFDAIDASKDGIMILPEYVPWQGTLLKEVGKAETIKFCIFPSNRGGYNVQTIPIEIRSNNHRCDFPKEWWGDHEKTGIKGCTFIHNSGFMAACDTLNNAIKLAKKAL